MKRLFGLVAGLALVTAAQAALRTKTVEYKHGDTVLKGYLTYDDAVKGKRPGQKAPEPPPPAAAPLPPPRLIKTVKPPPAPPMVAAEPEPVLPEELATPVLTLEGEEFPITGGVQGADGPGNSFVWVPSLKAVVTGDIVFDHVYFGVPRDQARQNWQKTIDQIAALKPAIVIPGHEGPGATRDMRSIDWMKKYMADWDANVSRSKDAAGMRANVLKQYPGLGMEFTLNDRVATYFPAKPAQGQ